MAISLAVAFIGSVVAAVSTGVLTARCFRGLRADVVFITLAMVGLTVALGALALGNLAGFGPITFRAMELGGQVLAPLALCLGTAEMAAQTISARFAVRLILSALAVVAFVILSVDQLNPAVAFSKAWPPASVYYETIPHDLLRFGIAPVSILAALIAIGVAAVRLLRHPAWQPAAVATGSAALAALVLAVPAAVSLPSGAAFAAACLAAAGLAWFAGVQAGKLRRDLLNGSFVYANDDEWDSPDSWGGHVDQTGDIDAVASGGGLYRGNGLFRPEDGDSASAYRHHDDDYDYERDRRDAVYLGDGYGRDEADGAYDSEYAGGYESDNSEASYSANGHNPLTPDARYQDYDDADHSEDIRASGSAAGRAAGLGIWGSADRPDEPNHLAAAGIPAGDSEARARLFGQIAIYTLLDERVDEFDLLTEQVVEQVQASEPDTLVYIVHAVPSAPMQRILYEVYRDRAAYDEHRRRPYVARFELERRPFVLATNVIELGLQQAKVSPLPSISDLLGPSGPGSPGFIPPDPGRQPGSGRTLPGSGRSQPRSGRSQPGSERSQPRHGRAGSGQSQSAESQLGYSPSGSSLPGYDEPPYDEAEHAEPGQAEPRYSPSGYSPPGYDQPAHDQSGYDQPGYDQPAYDQSGHDQSGYNQSGHGHPGYDQPGYDQPPYDEPGHGEPEYGQPGYGQPGYGEPGYGEAEYGEAEYGEAEYGEAEYGQPGYEQSQPGGPADREDGPHRQW